jgi:hypothetical protein
MSKVPSPRPLIVNGFAMSSGIPSDRILMTSSPDRIFFGTGGGLPVPDSRAAFPIFEKIYGSKERLPGSCRGRPVRVAVAFVWPLARGPRPARQFASIRMQN